jgi:hypothetical protein
VPSLDQLTVFLTVVETGSFAAAGRRLGRATSAVSYAITNLEQQLGVRLFDRDQASRPFRKSGTEGSNPLSSSGESCANQAPGRRDCRPQPYRLVALSPVRRWLL